MVKHTSIRRVNKMSDLSPEQEFENLKVHVRENAKHIVDEFIEENKIKDRDEIYGAIDDNGALTEMVDSSVPIYNIDLMNFATLMEVYNHENELPPAFDGENTPINITATAIYEILNREAWDEVDSYLEELEEKWEEEDDE